MLALRLPPEIEARLAGLAKRTGRTKSFYAREAILRHLDELEDHYLAESRLEDPRKGRSELVPLSVLIGRHGAEYEFERAAARELDKLDSRSPGRVLRFLRDRIAPLEDPRSIGQALKGDRFGDIASATIARSCGSRTPRDSSSR